jgi:opacity protein-like surface antigen
MKAWVALAIAALAATPASAQESIPQDPAGYIGGFGGAAWTDGNSTGSVVFEGGVRIAPHLMVFTNVGHFADLQADLQPTLDAATAALADQGLVVTAGGSLPAWYGIGGLRAEIATGARVLPYVVGGVGAARLSPTPQFTFMSGTMPDGSQPAVGLDITSTLISSGTYTAPPANTEFMLMLGGGVQVPLVTRWVADVGYRYSRIAADTALNTTATALNTNVLTFGVGYRF